ncbi:MAG: methionyl-tRNA formyltransferase [Verrucomicrobia bacterium]|nr:methionyl-tRNA formyltransferase [Verrucomicrobiota bacterium]MBS0647145.1 methionyl-tRNA formyltransferase [Verrucomicrobiota bacterium]
MRLVFFGTPPFARTILEYLIQNGADIVAVVTKPDKPVGRSATPAPSAVKQCALEHHLPLFQPVKASDPAFLDAYLKPLQADLYIVAAYSEILKENILATPRFGCINVHASLLPKYRGAAPIQRCILDGELASGVTIMAMDVGLDTGGMLDQVIVPITEDMTAGELSKELSIRGAEALWKVLQQVEKGEANATPQPSQSLPYAKKLKPEEGEIDWKRTSDQIYRQFRAMTPKPGAWCKVTLRGESKRLMIRAARQCSNVQAPAGTVLAHAGYPLVVACSQGALALLEVQLEGKKNLDARVFLNGITLDQLKFLTS